MRAAWLSLIFIFLNACGPSAPAIDPAAVAAWQAWRAEENAAWSTDEFAILKIDDAVYLNEGQSAWLTTRKQKRLEYAWALDALSAPGSLRVTHMPKGYKVQPDGRVVYPPMAEVSNNGKAESFRVERPQTVNVAPGIDVRFALTEVKPGVDGLRVMVYNQAHPAALGFKGLEYFAYSPDAVVEATFEASPNMEVVDFQTSRGWYKRFHRAGFALFNFDGKALRLAMYTDKAEAAQVTSLSAFFLDELSGKETSGVGRYLDIEVEGLPAKLAIDFNRAYNPYCARSPHYNCPLATDKLPVALRAGERIPSKH
jgi:uncharacterized protein (DUF1684 family)